MNFTSKSVAKSCLNYLSRDLEGMVAKQLTQPLCVDDGNPAWVKIKN